MSLTIAGATLLAGLIGAGVTGVTSAIGTSQTNRTNREVASQNIAFQQRENEITRQREDTAYSRAAADLQRAGLSKTLAAGSPASSSSLTAPQNSYVQKDSPISKAFEKVDLANLIMNVYKTESEVNKNNAEKDYFNSLGTGQQLSNNSFAENFRNEQNLKRANFALIQSQTDYNKAKTVTENVVGSKQADYMEAEIAKSLSTVNLNDSRIRYNDALLKKTAQDIVESIARSSKMSAEEKLVYQDLALAMLKENIELYNLAVAYGTGVKTTDASPTMLGVPVGAGVRVADELLNNNIFKESYYHNLAFSFKH